MSTAGYPIASITYSEIVDVRMAEYLSEDLIFLDLDAADKLTAFKTIVRGMARHRYIKDPSTFLDELLEREKVEPTCMGRGVAFPHTRTALVKQPVIAFARPRRPIPFNDRPADDVHLIFVMGTPKAEANLYLDILARLCKVLRQPEFRRALQGVKTPGEALRLFQESEASSGARPQPAPAR